jgi:hypothetical protein
MKYNTNNEPLKLPEYGRNIQNIVHYIGTIKDREKRNKLAKYIIRMMSKINQSSYENAEHKLWFHLAFMSNFNLDIDYPVEINPEEITTKAELPKYPKNTIKVRYYGKNIEMILEKLCQMEDSEDKQILLLATANQMKKYYFQWAKSHVTDDIIFKDIKRLSNGKLSLSPDTKLVYVKDTFTSTTSSKRHKKNYKNKRK